MMMSSSVHPLHPKTKKVCLPSVKLYAKPRPRPAPRLCVSESESLGSCPRGRRRASLLSLLVFQLGSDLWDLRGGRYLSREAGGPRLLSRRPLSSSMPDVRLCLEAVSALLGCRAEATTGSSQFTPQDLVNVVALKEFYKQEGFKELEYPSLGTLSLHELDEADMYSSPPALEAPPERSQLTVEINTENFFHPQYDYDFTNVKVSGTGPRARDPAGFSHRLTCTMIFKYTVTFVQHRSGFAVKHGSVTEGGSHSAWKNKPIKIKYPSFKQRQEAGQRSSSKGQTQRSL